MFTQSTQKPPVGLNDELLLYIFRYLNLSDLLHVAVVNRQWRAVASDDTLWRPQAKRYLENNHFPAEAIERLNNIGSIKLLLKNSLFVKKHIKQQQQKSSALIDEYKTKLQAIRREQDEYHEELMSQPSSSSYHYNPIAPTEPTTVVKGYACLYILLMMFYQSLKEKHYSGKLRDAETKYKSIIRQIESKYSQTLERKLK